MRRKDLEITLSINVKGFSQPKIELEQYQTPSRVAANLVYRAYTLNDIDERRVIDICAGTGILGISAVLLGANVTMLEVDNDALLILKENCERLDINAEILNIDLFSWNIDKQYDTAILNPPFGIKQKKNTDMDFVRKAADISKIVYSIHDGSITNQNMLPKLFDKHGLKILEIYLDEFLLKKSYIWHTKINKIFKVMVIRSTKKT